MKSEIYGRYLNAILEIQTLSLLIAPHSFIKGRTLEIDHLCVHVVLITVINKIFIRIGLYK